MRGEELVKEMPFTAAEIKILAQSPAAVQALIDYYENEEAKFEAIEAIDRATKLETRRLQLEDALRNGLKTGVPAPASIPAPGRVETSGRLGDSLMPVEAESDSPTIGR